MRSKYLSFELMEIVRKTFTMTQHKLIIVRWPSRYKTIFKRQLLIFRIVGKAIQLPEKRLSYRQIEHDEVIAMHYSDYEEFSESEERLSQSSTDVTPQNSPRVSIAEDLGEHRLSREKVSFYPMYNDEADLPDSFCSLLQITPIHIHSPYRKRQNPSILRSEIASSRWMRNPRPDSSLNCDRNSAKSFVSLDTRNYGNTALSASERNALMNNRVVTARHRDLARLEPICTPEIPQSDVTRLPNVISPHYSIRKVSLPPLLLEEEKRKVSVGSAKKHNVKTRKTVSKSLFQLDRVKHNWRVFEILIGKCDLKHCTKF